MIAGVAALAVPGLAAADQAGYRDADGVFHIAKSHYSAAAGYAAPSASGYGVDAAYVGSDPVDARESAIARRIRLGETSGALGSDEAEHAYRDLDRIRLHEADLVQQHDGLTNDDRADIAIRLDGLNDRLSDEFDGD
jgi:hypothetical protein